MTDVCMVFFKAKKCNISTAIRFLNNYGLTVINENKKILVHRGASQKFEVFLNESTFVQKEAIEVAENTEYSSEMKECNHRFEVLIPNLEEALDEINTLMEIQGALQDASQGYLFISWNGNLSGPWIR